VVWWENVKEEDRLEDLNVDKRLKMKRMLKNGIQGGGVNLSGLEYAEVSGSCKQVNEFSVS
jgi:hypothetical protein